MESFSLYVITCCSAATSSIYHCIFSPGRKLSPTSVHSYPSVLFSKMKLDPKVKNLLKFMLQNIILPVVALFVAIRFFGITDYFRLIGQLTIGLLAWKAWTSFYRRVLLPPKKPLEYGKWAIVTGNLPFMS